MPQKEITAFGQRLVMACDGKCFKAWGINSRPKVSLSDDPDDYVWVRDSAMAQAPANPGTYEGGHGKPGNRQLGPESGHHMNKWCFRECERSSSSRLGEPIKIRDLEHPKPNILAHTQTGNCWAPARCCTQGCGTNLCDVCHEHAEPRGECSECPPCTVCEKRQ